MSETWIKLTVPRERAKFVAAIVEPTLIPNLQTSEVSGFLQMIDAAGDRVASHPVAVTVAPEVLQSIVEAFAACCQADGKVDSGTVEHLDDAAVEAQVAKLAASVKR